MTITLSIYLRIIENKINRRPQESQRQHALRAWTQAHLRRGRETRTIKRRQVLRRTCCVRLGACVNCLFAV